MCTQLNIGANIDSRMLLEVAALCYRATSRHAAFRKEGYPPCATFPLVLGGRDREDITPCVSCGTGYAKRGIRMVEQVQN